MTWPRRRRSCASSTSRSPPCPGAAEWDRNLFLFLPNATVIPNVEQTGGQFTIHTPVEFMEIIEEHTVIGGPDDEGFQEGQMPSLTEGPLPSRSLPDD